MIGLALVIAQAVIAQPNTVIRVNQVGYLPDAPKTAVACSLEPESFDSFTIVDMRGRRIFGPAAAVPRGAFGPCQQTHELTFTRLHTPGEYIIVLGRNASPMIRISNSAYRGAADTLLAYMREQRSGFNPLFRDSTHKKDGILVDHPTRTGEYIRASGGWADAADYLQYVTTSAYATYIMMMAHRDHPRVSQDRFASNGLAGPNRRADILDEARHGLEWLLAMFPERDLMLNQLADDRDHTYFDLPVNDSADYGWGKGGARPLYPCTGQPQGLFKYKNRSTGKASTAGKFAAAFALGARMFKDEPEFAQLLTRKARQAYDVGMQNPGVCQTAPGRAPYFYEEDDWADDMELAAAELYDLTHNDHYRTQGMRFAALAPVKPWMGSDTAKHYQWFPWHNNGHYELWRNANAAQRATLAGYYRDAMQRVTKRAETNAFRIGIPFIWCSNNLVASFAIQARLYRLMTHDDRFIKEEFAAIDWLFGTNPWGVSMVIGYPANGRTALDPHSVIAARMGVATQRGGLLDGPVYRSIFGNLLAIRLREPDEYAAYNTGFIVYHDDLGDYSTNEPIMDGTANMTYLLSALSR